ncbi:MotA/TolQ/ExbB proton channel family protein [Epibacterium sp. MM17-32]|uniref:MotA/TolQ/ExbB proton channel family protein n=1 Tax=Epibacterium sp. MM17-32 TaxID=2917734 RepID=UPI001EF4309F|nr:MotA/TolQ/ExbB proton channel family protein [Epibacterium sp. MM17-32]MCG7629362.1 MotA/TolQ/ExbB proton channel family protein [Epibacterium sp. MM17-32]
MERLLENVGTGAPILLVLAMLSLLSLTIIIAKGIELRSVLSGEDTRRDAISRWRKNEKPDALRMIGTQTPADRVLSFAMSGTLERLRPALLQSELERRGSAELLTLAHRLRILEITAMISPLLGLLGTVLGMIQSFQELELAEGAANAALLAGGIWQALLTTAAGLLVAIPAAIAAGLYSARIERVAQSIERSIGQFLLAEEATQPAGDATREAP